jgi:hypothetical protein
MLMVSIPPPSVVPVPTTGHYTLKVEAHIAVVSETETVKKWDNHEIAIIFVHP